MKSPPAPWWTCAGSLMWDLKREPGATLWDSPADSLLNDKGGSHIKASRIAKTPSMIAMMMFKTRQTLGLDNGPERKPAP